MTLVETPVLQEIRSRLDVTEGLRPPTPSHTTTLRVKSEQDEQVYTLPTVICCSLLHKHDCQSQLSLHHLVPQTYVLKMKYSDTIGDVRKHIDRLR